jgi:putative transcriptional regulator
MRAAVVSSAIALMVWTLGGLVPAPAAGRAQGLGDRLHRGAVKALASGKLLVSAREMADPNFARTVVLLADYTPDGALGFILNRPAKVTLSQIFPRFAQSAEGMGHAFLGGPVVTPGAVAALTRSGAGGARRVLDEVYLVSSREQLEEAIASGAGSNRLRVYLGYAGWGAGQLADETARGAWRILDGDAAIVFDPNPDEMWRRQILRTEALSASISGREKSGGAIQVTRSAARRPAARRGGRVLRAGHRARATRRRHGTTAAPRRFRSRPARRG